MFILPQLKIKKGKHLSEEVENREEFGHWEAFSGWTKIWKQSNASHFC